MSYLVVYSEKTVKDRQKMHFLFPSRSDGQAGGVVVLGDGEFLPLYSAPVTTAHSPQLVVSCKT
jgi:hypothetical protein